MVKEGIILGHKISKKIIEVDRAKIEIIVKFPPSTYVKGIHSFLGHAKFYSRLKIYQGLLQDLKPNMQIA